MFIVVVANDNHSMPQFLFKRPRLGMGCAQAPKDVDLIRCQGIASEILHRILYRHAGEPNNIRRRFSMRSMVCCHEFAVFLQNSKVGRSSSVANMLTNPSAVPAYTCAGVWSLVSRRAVPNAPASRISTLIGSITAQPCR